MPSTELDPNKDTGLHQTLNRSLQTSRKQEKSRSGRAPRWAKVTGGILVAAVVGGGYVGIHKVNEKRHDRKVEIATEQTREIRQVQKLHDTGAHVADLNKTVVLLQGTKIRSSMLQANPDLKYPFGHNYIPSNINHVVGEGEVVIADNPILRDEGARWIQATRQPTETEDFEKGSAKALNQATISVNLTGLVEQGAALICHVPRVVEYATVSENYGYVDQNGNPTATYDTYTLRQFDQMRNSGRLVCDNSN